MTLEKLVKDAPHVKVYRVGGYVRDKLLGLSPSDCDYVVVGATPQLMLDLGFIQVGKDFPVFLDREGNEFALARREKKSGKGYGGFETDIENVSLEEDLKRRDLTINAIAEDLEGNIIDPFKGVQDIHNRILRHVSDAFSEDPLRVLRVARFQASFKYFSIAPETLQLIQKIKKSGELQYLKIERVRLEVEKSIKKGDIYLFFQTLANLQVLDEVFPSVRNFEILQRVKPENFHQLIKLLSIHNSIDAISVNFQISKKLYRESSNFTKNFQILQGEREPAKLRQLFRSYRNIQSPQHDLELYSLIGLDIDIPKYLNVFQQLQAVAKEIYTSEIENKKEVLETRELEVCKSI